jgi:hypothetical protein
MLRGISEIELENGICIIVGSSMSIFRHAVELEALLSTREWSATRCVQGRTRCLHDGPSRKCRPHMDATLRSDVSSAHLVACYQVIPCILASSL